MLDALGAEPLLQLGLPLLHAAANFLNQMATFSSAQVGTGAQ